MNDTLAHLREAEAKAEQLFRELEQRKLIVAGKTEAQLNREVFALAEEVLGIRKYWHKRIVRAGKNTLLPYRENPENLALHADDIVFFDFGPVFDEWEADFGRTYVLGNNPIKRKLQADVALAWQQGKDFYEANKNHITGAELYAYTCQLAQTMGWEYGNEHCGHLVGKFPHEKIVGEERVNYIHPENTIRMLEPDARGEARHWIYEIHFVDRRLEIGGFYEQLLS
jgi:Xaa-Pro aminopeptidase